MPTEPTHTWKTFDYTVTLKGPGGTIENRYEGGIGSANFNVVPGIWNVTVKGTNTVETSGSEYFIMGVEQIEIKPNKKYTEPITLYNAYEIKEWGDFNTANTLAPGRPMIYLIANDLKADTSVTPDLGREFFLVAEKEVTIKKGSGFNDSFFTFKPNGSDTVNLGKPGMSGTITFDNENIAIPTAAGLIVVNNSGTLIMHDGITIRGGNFSSSKGAGIFLNRSCSTSKFIMNGGIITDNHVHGGTTPEGGGVYLDDDGWERGYFKQNGGTITGNSPKNIFKGTWIW